MGGLLGLKEKISLREPCMSVTSITILMKSNLLVYFADMDMYWTLEFVATYIYASGLHLLSLLMRTLQEQRLIFVVQMYNARFLSNYGLAIKNCHPSCESNFPPQVRGRERDVFKDRLLYKY